MFVSVRERSKAYKTTALKIYLSKLIITLEKSLKFFSSDMIYDLRLLTNIYRTQLRF